MGRTTIEWTDASWNPIVGCTEISPGCANCYAARLAATRLKYTPQYKGLATIDNPPANIGPRWNGEIRFIPERIEEPKHWKKPRKIFVCDMGDLFHENVADEWIEKVLITIHDCPQHTFQVLTKRADRMLAWFQKEWTIYGNFAAPLPNLWLGVSVENQHFANERIPLLLHTPAHIHWISAEPLLGPLDMKGLFTLRERSTLHPGWEGLDWVVCGGESGPNARPLHPDWVRSLRDQCNDSCVPFFFKQWGQFLPGTYRDCNGSVVPYFSKVGKKAAGRYIDGRTWNQFPDEHLMMKGLEQ
jgi:protein gp37